MKPRAPGVSLVELLVALAIGTALVAGAVTVYSNGRNTYALNESVARMQEKGRYVMSVLEPDLELAGYYLFTNSPDTLRFVRDGNPGLVVATAAQMRQEQAPIGAVPANAHDCGTNFPFDVLRPVQGSDGVFALGPGRSGSCAPYGSGWRASTDTLTIRRASTDPAEPTARRLQIYGSRLSSRSSQLLFADGQRPGPLLASSAVRDLIVRAYYVAQDSVGRNGYPALRVLSLGAIDRSPPLNDVEVMPGVEDLQVQFGIDTGDYDNDGAIDPGNDINEDGIPETDGRTTRYVDPDFPDLNRFQVVAVRVWVRVRAEDPELGFVDNRLYQYANVDYTPAGEERSFRRMLVSRTIALRNARTL